MEEDDEIRSSDSPADFRSSDPSSPASAAMVPSQAFGGGGGNDITVRGSGGGREDCWSEGATAVLIDAWGERFLELRRGNLKQKHWKELAEIVSSRENYGKSPKTDVQCKNRIDTVKKKYKQEKARMAAGGGSSRWIFFQKLDPLIGPTAKLPVADDGTSFSKVPMGIPLSSRSYLYRREVKTMPTPPQREAAKRSIESTRWHFRNGSASETDSESEPKLSADSRDSLPPPPPKRKREGGGGGRREFGKLTRAVSRFCEAYEKAEIAKLKQMAEMEKERMQFVKEMELQRMEFFLKTQMEISKLKQHKRRNRGEVEGIRIISNVRNGKNDGDVCSRVKKKRVVIEDESESSRDKTQCLNETTFFMLPTRIFCTLVLTCVRNHLIQTFLHLVEHFLDGFLDIPD